MGLEWVAFACYLEWGIVHIFAGGISLYFLIAGDLGSYVTGICGGAKALHEDCKKCTTWNPLNTRILLQHALNLGSVGLYSVALAIWAVTDLNRYSYYLGLWPFFMDIGYFVAIDTVHYGEPPGEMQTVIISVAQISMSFAVKKDYPIVAGEAIIQLVIPGLLIACAAVNKLLHVTRPAQVSPPLVAES